MSTTSRKEELTKAYDSVLKQVNAAATEDHPVCLVAVSKLKPSSDIAALYEHGVRHFGENYVQELVTKSKELPKDIKWHFIGGLQTGKCKDLARNIENLYAVETIDSIKKCKKLDTIRAEVNGSPINISLQINTSDEEQKSGYSAHDLKELYESIEFLLSDSCKTLKLKGLMTIGSFSESITPGEENKDFKVLSDLKKHLEEKYNIPLELSMGMSNDYLQAIRQGSSSVRVGTSIFGARPPKNA